MVWGSLTCSTLFYYCFFRHLEKKWQFRAFFVITRHLFRPKKSLIYHFIDFCVYIFCCDRSLSWYRIIKTKFSLISRWRNSRMVENCTLYEVHNRFKKKSYYTNEFRFQILNILHCRYYNVMMLFYVVWCNVWLL